MDRRDLAVELEALLPRVTGDLFRSGNDPLGDLAVAQIRILRRLSDGPMTMTELASTLEFSKPFASKVVDKLAKKQLVTRTPEPTDNRVKMVSLSLVGKDLMCRRSEERSERAAKFLAALSDEEISGMMRGLHRLRAVIQEMSKK